MIRDDRLSRIAESAAFPPGKLTPETRASLLIRIRDPQDQAAWCEFVEIYWPVIIRLALRRGMQSADAEDIAQTVLLAVSKSIELRAHDRQRAQFRTWLNRVAQNAILNALTRGKPDRGAGDSGLLAILEQQPMASASDSEMLRLEYRREVFRWAARQIQVEFEPATWKAFWMTTVEGRDPAEAAQTCGKAIGSIYASRSRVMRRLREKVAEYELPPR